MKKNTITSSFGTNGRFSHDSSKFYESRLYENISINTIESYKENEITSEKLDSLYCKSSENMSELPDNSVHLMITSPPYNVTKEYDDDLSFQEYLNLLKKIFTETYRVLVNGGRVCINVANLGRKPYIPLSDYLSIIMSEIGYNMRGEIIWNKAASASPSTAWGSWKSASNPTLRDIHEYILIFSKGDYKRNLTKAQKPNKQNTISKENFMEWTKSVWAMKAESAKKIGHPAPFPIELPKRLIELYSFKNDVILDPFVGSGTTAIAAVDLNRHYIGYDTNQDYIDLAKNRLGSLNYKIEFD